uniref:EGF-like domain-containing protein n=1 Tax=Chromera velia CCMP2878 TaxID=1169474 RepID=A0A0G4HAU1_9ALVE|eukprot:Cvel_6072.t1-p1 / transcript=Cvel_6072.t1 / gene=Cvel_6072 / organism=Chromera_velia_CCMP2878 / gene_product=Epidermal growth factor-like protein 6, putative / transcript_product=Epidermal growth factor-like protein 6, putative / location=Cvel_scaffold292:14994-21943(+) / protein_length=918 / sequence_SO=supercontig / SO=protein_coding / is_pseudo=false
MGVRWRCALVVIVAILFVFTGGMGLPFYDNFDNGTTLGSNWTVDFPTFSLANVSVFVNNGKLCVDSNTTFLRYDLTRGDAPFIWLPVPGGNWTASVTVETAQNEEVEGGFTLFDADGGMGDWKFWVRWESGEFRFLVTGTGASSWHAGNVAKASSFPVRVLISFDDSRDSISSWFYDTDAGGVWVFLGEVRITARTRLALFASTNQWNRNLCFSNFTLEARGSTAIWDGSTSTALCGAAGVCDTGSGAECVAVGGEAKCVCPDGNGGDGTSANPCAAAASTFSEAPPTTWSPVPSVGPWRLDVVQPGIFSAFTPSGSSSGVLILSANRASDMINRADTFPVGYLDVPDGAFTLSLQVSSISCPSVDACGVAICFYPSDGQTMDLCLRVSQQTVYGGVFQTLISGTSSIPEKTYIMAGTAYPIPVQVRIRREASGTLWAAWRDGSDGTASWNPAMQPLSVTQTASLSRVGFGLENVDALTATSTVEVKVQDLLVWSDSALTNECPTSTLCVASENSTCVDTMSSFFCHCPWGFETVNATDNFTCVENFCANALTHNCDSSATCNNTDTSSFICTCNDGYEGTGVACAAGMRVSWEALAWDIPAPTATTFYLNTSQPSQGGLVNGELYIAGLGPITMEMQAAQSRSNSPWFYLPTPPLGIRFSVQFSLMIPSVSGDTIGGMAFGPFDPSTSLGLGCAVTFSDFLSKTDGPGAEVFHPFGGSTVYIEDIGNQARDRWYVMRMDVDANRTVTPLWSQNYSNTDLTNATFNDLTGGSFGSFDTSLCDNAGGRMDLLGFFLNSQASRTGTSNGAVYYRDFVLTVMEVDECSTGRHNCANPGGNCTDAATSFVCSCTEGFGGDGVTCTGGALGEIRKWREFKEAAVGCLRDIPVETRVLSLRVNAAMRMLAVLTEELEHPVLSDK